MRRNTLTHRKKGKHKPHQRENSCLKPSGLSFGETHTNTHKHTQTQTQTQTHLKTTKPLKILEF